MNFVSILSAISKAVTVIQVLYAAGKEAAPAIEALKNLVTGAQAGTVTDEQLAETEALLDQMMADFNADI